MSGSLLNKGLHWVPICFKFKVQGLSSDKVCSVLNASPHIHLKLLPFCFECFISFIKHKSGV